MTFQNKFLMCAPIKIQETIENIYRSVTKWKQALNVKIIIYLSWVLI